MENQTIKIVLLPTKEILISQIEEVSSDIGEPDCKLVEPFTINPGLFLEPWLVEYTNQNYFLIHSDKILTIIEPNSTILEKYKGLLT